ncbi:SMI1/KNR4 family protein [Niabella sp. CC-SYL272]|uniref:SMI1/KNR4 family protein n=1 Tax=Niabella agricola TaxID=2891571 RepID=UPI001F46AD37|nr:SMI1/KNR4 family protein [Niabella agricola]MCF3109577.1 SMI1/KNR4 family protein [Niabella agricola]
MMKQEIERISQKLQLLRDADPDLVLFGAKKHKYRLNDPLPAEVLAQFEAAHSIKLPEGFSDFYTTLGNGGAGPFYGLEPLENVLFSDLDYKRADSLLDPSVPFAHTQPWNRSFTPTVQEEESELRFETEHEAFYKAYYSSEQMNGVLAICNYGCGISLNLVVNGPEYGNMWTDDRGNDAGIYPSTEFGNEEKINFLDWYELWLDSALVEAKEKYARRTPK